MNLLRKLARRGIPGLLSPRISGSHFIQKKIVGRNPNCGLKKNPRNRKCSLFSGAQIEYKIIAILAKRFQRVDFMNHFRPKFTYKTASETNIFVWLFHGLIVT
jgi:hypothetical protein